MPLTDGAHRSPPAGHLLARVRIQEADQRIRDAADRIVAFLAVSPGRVVDTALSSDEVREIAAVGHVVKGATLAGRDAWARGDVDG